MANQLEGKQHITLALIAAYSAVAYMGTILVQVPIPGTDMFFNLSDTVVMVAALLHGPLIGGITGFLGPALADALSSPQFILVTSVVKGLEGIIIGLIAWQSTKRSILKPFIALLIGVIFLVGGYFLFEAFIYPLLADRVPFYPLTDVDIALTQIIPNLIHGFISAVISFGILRIFGKKSNHYGLKL